MEKMWKIRRQGPGRGRAFRQTQLLNVTLVFLLVCISTSFGQTTASDSVTSIVSSGPSAVRSIGSSSITFLQSELSQCSAAQQSILSFLRQKNVPIGTLPGSLRSKSNGGSGSDDILSRITMSTKDKEVECRISLGSAPEGAKCVAPCGCTGSQKWVQFAELNKLRRKDPSQWQVCRTCQQSFDYSMFTVYGGLPANLVGYLLDHMSLIRVSIAVGVGIVCCTMRVESWISRVLTSKALWQKVIVMQSVCACC